MIYYGVVKSKNIILNINSVWMGGEKNKSFIMVLSRVKINFDSIYFIMIKINCSLLKPTVLTVGNDSCYNRTVSTVSRVFL